MPRYVIATFVVILCFYSGIYALWVHNQHELYFQILRSLGTLPWDRPFLDMTGVLSWGECHRRGFDVLSINPCDPLNRLLNYSPLLLELGLRSDNSTAVSLMQDFAFLIAAPLVLRPRSIEELGVAIMGCLSTVAIYALERGNLDLSIFVLLAVTGLFSRSMRTGRILSYAIYFVGGLIKIYPFALLLTVLRDSPRIALGLAIISALLIGFFAAYYGNDIERIASLLPSFSPDSSDMYDTYTSDVFGAYVLPLGVASYLSLPLARNVLFVLLVIGFGAFSLGLARKVRSVTADADWSHLNFHFLLVGSIVLVGCFLTQSNIGYRAIFVLLLLPGLFDLRRRSTAEPLKRVFNFTIWLALWCMWREMFGLWLGNGLRAINPQNPEHALGQVPLIAYFVGRELIWWFLISVMAAIVIAFARSSPGGRAVIGLLHRRISL